MRGGDGSVSGAADYCVGVTGLYTSAVDVVADADLPLDRCLVGAGFAGLNLHPSLLIPSRKIHLIIQSLTSYKSRTSFYRS